MQISYQHVPLAPTDSVRDKTNASRSPSYNNTAALCSSVKARKRGTMPDSCANAAHQNVLLDSVNDVSTPLAGTVICCTSVPDEKRTKLAAQAEQMGAVHRYDLTLDVTHLIVGKYDTEKYRYVARERPDVRPMTVEWIEAVRELWINDKEIDIAQLEREQTLPTLHSLKFSMTGCDDPADRLKIAEQVKANGAIYEGDLTKQITHLISFRTEGAKYKAAKAWGIKIISIEWLWDTLERGMILNEDLYDPVLPARERGKGAWDRTKPKRTSLGKRARGENVAITEGGKRKLRRTASTKLNSQNERIWGDIVGGAMIPQVNRSGQWEPVAETMLKSTESGRKEVEPSANNGKRQLNVENPQTKKGMFSECHFYHHGFPPERAQILCDHLLSHGAQISDAVEDLVSPIHRGLSSRLFMIVPHDLSISLHPPLPQSQPPIETVTVWWLERCLHHKKFMEPKEHVIGRPFRSFPIKGFAQLSISTSAFTGIDLLHVTRAIQLLGATYSEDMTPQSSVVVARSLDQLRKDKFDHAQEWKIPIVSANWLWDSIEVGTRLPFQTYRARSRKLPGSLPNTAGASLLTGKLEVEPCTNEHTKLGSGSSSNGSKNLERLPRHPSLDDTAFTHNKPTVKEEHESFSFEPTADASNSTTQEHSSKSEPLSERDLNSSSKTVSTAPAPSDHPAPRPQEDYSNAISDLLAKTKTATAQTPHNEASKLGRRDPKRILGRVASNMSTGSTSHSRATSVDSTATHGHPVEYPPCSTGIASGQTANERIEMLMNGDKNIGRKIDSQPPATQLEYDDPESKEAEQRAMARMMGEKVDSKRPGIKEKALTVGDVRNIKDKPRTRRAGRERTGIR